MAIGGMRNWEENLQFFPLLEIRYRIELKILLSKGGTPTPAPRMIVPSPHTTYLTSVHSTA